MGVMQEKCIRKEDLRCWWVVINSAIRQWYWRESKGDISSTNCEENTNYE